MKNFKIELLTPSKSELEMTGVDKIYIDSALKQHTFRTVKITSLSCAQANILKQTAISCGTDCSVHRETITGKIERTDCILSGSLREFEKIAEKLSYQPLKLKILSEELKEIIFGKPQNIVVNGKIFDWTKTYIMGILNITPDSFSDGGSYFDTEKALSRAAGMIEDGVDIIDVGGESTRPYSEIVPVDEEISRIKPVIEAIRKFNTDIPISIDTRNAKTAEVAIQSGANIVNDVSAGDWDSEMFKTCAEFNVPLILNHSQGTPDNMQDNPHYENCIDEIKTYLFNKAEEAKNAGVKNIIIDPGIGFGKTTEQNLDIIKNIDRFLTPDYPLLVGHSRKTFLRELFHTSDRETLDKATAIVSEYLAQKSVNILRVHDVKGHKPLKIFGNF